ncbi:hypothetical protein cypCar_00016440 [Cyprinus carpio]|nr:hypothetical protein cypCar_00016440 [Cyprinus carpio]
MVPARLTGTRHMEGGPEAAEQAHLWERACFPLLQGGPTWRPQKSEGKRWEQATKLNIVMKVYDIFFCPVGLRTGVYGFISCVVTCDATGSTPTGSGLHMSHIAGGKEI